jgi:hypothetical protein
LVKKLAPTKPETLEILTNLQLGKFGMEQHGSLGRKNPEKNRISTSINPIASGSLAMKLPKVFLFMLGLAKN